MQQVKTNLQNNLPRKNQPTAMDMGLISISTALAEISQNTIEGNKILKSISLGIDNISLFLGNSLLLPINWNINHLRTKSKHNVFLKISDRLNELVDYFINKPKQDSANVINNISNQTQQINNTQTLNADSQKSSKSNPNSVIPELDSLIKTLSTSLNKKLFKLMSDFRQAFLEMIDFDPKKATSFSLSFKKITTTLSEFSKVVKPLAFGILLLSGSFLLLSLVTANPLLIVGLGIIALFMHFIKESVGETVGGMMKLGIGIILMVYGLSKVEGINFEPVFTLLKFIFLLRLALVALPFATSLPKKIKTFAFGILFLVWALYGVGKLPFESLIKMVLFIVTLGISLRIFNKMGGGEGVAGPGVGAMMKFGLGLGIMILALMAIEDIPFSAVAKLLVFIGLLTMEIAISNKIGGGMGPMKGLPGFAFGLGLLIIAMLAIDDIPVMGALKLLAFIAALNMELFLMDKLGGGGVKQYNNGLPGFAFGLGLLVLAMYAMDELPWLAIGKMLLFIAGLGIALRFFPKTGNLSLVGIGVGILLIIGAFWIFKKIDFTVADALTFTLSVGLIVALVGVMGITPLNVAIGIGSVLLILVAVSALIAAGALGLISIIPIDLISILTFVIGAGIIVIGFALLAIPAVGAVVGSVLFLIISVSSLISAGMLGLISIIPLNIGNIALFLASSAIIIAGFALLAVPAIPGLLGATLFVPIAVLSLLNALMLLGISSLPIKLGNITDFMLGVSSIVGGFALLAVPAVIALVGAGLFVPVAGAALIGAFALSKISALNINPKKIDIFGKSMDSLVSGFNNLGLFSLGKSAIKAKLILPLLSTSQRLTSLFNDISKTDIQGGNTGLLTMIDSLTIIMLKLESWKNKNAITSIKTINDFANTLENLKTSEFSSISDVMTDFLNILSDNKKWDDINNHLITLKNNFKDIVTNINMLDFKKALLLNDTLKFLSTKDTTDNLNEVIKNLREMIGLLYDQAKIQAETKPVDPLAPTSSIIPLPDGTKAPETPFAELTQKSKEEQQQADLIDGLVEALESATLTVQLIGDSNKIGRRG